MNIRKLLDTDSAYYQFLQKIREYPDDEIEKKLNKIKKEFPILLTDRYSPVAIYILDYKHQNYAYMSSSVETIIGYKAEKFYEHGIGFTLNLIHPEDYTTITEKIMKKFLNIVYTLNINYLNHYRFSWNYRAKRSDGVYIQILQQLTVALVDENKNPLLYVGTTADISSVKKDNSIIFSVAKYDIVKNIFREIESVIHHAGNPLSEREVQVLRAIADQKNNQQISETHNIAVNTVRAHRRNILKKTNCNKISAAIAKTQREGWI